MVIDYDDEDESKDDNDNYDDDDDYDYDSSFSESSGDQGAQGINRFISKIVQNFDIFI